MRVSTAFLPLFAASITSASLFGSSSQDTLADDNTFAVPGKNPLTFCADPESYILTVDHVDLSPNPPNPGEKLTISANGTFSQDVEEGATVFLQVKYGLITLIKQEADLCENLPKIDLGCPIKKGPMTISKEVDIPKQVPPGKYTVLADVNTKDKEKITCMQSTVFFHKP